MDVVSQKNVELQDMHDQKNKSFQGYLEMQSEANVYNSQKRHLEMKLADAENEIIILRRRVTSLESSLRESDSRVEEAVGKATKAKLELQQKENELNRSQEVLESLQEVINPFHN